MDLSALTLALGFGLAFILAGVWFFTNVHRFMSSAHPVSAVVVGSEDRGNCYREDGRLECWAVFEYISSTGNVVKAKQNTSQSMPPVVGQTKAMLVDPQKPETLRLPGVGEYLLPLMLSLNGIVFLCIAAANF